MIFSGIQGSIVIIEKRKGFKVYQHSKNMGMKRLDAYRSPLIIGVVALGFGISVGLIKKDYTDSITQQASAQQAPPPAILLR